jgi:hypothetical protein
MSTSPPPTATGSSKLDAVKAKTMAAHIDPTAPTGVNLYARFAFAGAVCCSLTHGALTPVDVYVVLPPMAREMPMAAARMRMRQLQLSRIEYDDRTSS